MKRVNIKINHRNVLQTAWPFKGQINQGTNYTLYFSLMFVRDKHQSRDKLYFIFCMKLVYAVH